MLQRASLLAALVSRAVALRPPKPRGSLRRMAAAVDAAEDDPLVQYLVLRRDLQEKEAWPLGALVAQGAHAAVAAVAESIASEDTAAYVAPDALGRMTKAVLEVKGEPQLTNLAAKLSEAGVKHHLWVEQPEAVPTCLATAPARKSLLRPHFKKCQLSSWHAPKS
mmetsp:Transcript_8691/g.26149  ORF Transcript_8691/g.26149 Transcript_8691/m.26149 type:complete len:165 (-) Transcript_8691:22-516(-)